MKAHRVINERASGNLQFDESIVSTTQWNDIGYLMIDHWIVDMSKILLHRLSNERASGSQWMAVGYPMFNTKMSKNHFPI